MYEATEGGENVGESRAENEFKYSEKCSPIILRSVIICSLTSID
jgi:hypothetical protein